MFSASHAVNWSGHDSLLTFSLTQYPVSPGTATHPSLLAGSELIKHVLKSSYRGQLLLKKMAVTMQRLALEHVVPTQFGMQAINYCKIKISLHTKYGLTSYENALGV